MGRTSSTDRLRARLMPRRALTGGVAAVVAVPLALVLARADGLPASRVELSGGGAWLASPSQGLVTLIDGASEQVVGSVRAPGAQAGDELSVVQAGSSAYIVDPTQGTVSRVDGGTYAVSAPVRFGLGGGQLGVLTGGPGLYVVDGSRRIASVTDPVSLRVRQRLSLAAAPGPGQSAVDGAGRLWVVDSGGGGLTWFDGGKRVRPDGADARARLVLVRGQPVLVDVARPRVGRLTADGTVPSWSCLDTRAGDSAELLGSAVTARVYAAVSATGTLVAAGVDRDDCTAAVEVGKPGDEFGPLVEADGFVLVPNRSSGRTVVVDVAARQVVADLDVVKPGARLQLLVKDGLVFYNDLDSDRAGVIRFDGGRWRVGTALRKYNRSKTGEGILTPSGAEPAKEKPATEKPGQQPGKPEPDPSQPDPGQPGGQDPNQADPNEPVDPSQPDPNQPDPVPSTPPGSSSTPPAPPPPPPPKPPVIRSLTWNPDVVVREVEATFRAKVDNAQGASWAWTILDPATGATLNQDSTPDSLTVRLPAGTPANLQIRLEVRNAVGPATPVTRAFTTTSSLAPQIDSLTASTTDAAISQPLTFAAVESVAGDRGTWTWTVAGPGGPSGPIPGTPARDLARTFDTAGQYTVTLTVSYDGASADRSVQVAVSDKATLVRATGDPVDLRSGSSPSVQVRLVGSFVPQDVAISPDSWLQVSDFGGITIQPGGTGSVLLSVRGTPPNDGLNSNSLTFSLRNGNSVTYDVLANKAPVWNNYAVCIGGGTGPTTFYADFLDATLPTLTVTLRVGSASFRMDYTDGGPSGHGEFFWLEVPRANLPDVQTWTVQATDEFGEISDVGTAQRGQCWT